VNALLELVTNITAALLMPVPTSNAADDCCWFKICNEPLSMCNFAIQNLIDYCTRQNFRGRKFGQI